MAAQADAHSGAPPGAAGGAPAGGAPPGAPTTLILSVTVNTAVKTSPIGPIRAHDSPHQGIGVRAFYSFFYRNYFVGDIGPELIQNGPELVGNSPKRSKNTFGTLPNKID